MRQAVLYDRSTSTSTNEPLFQGFGDAPIHFAFALADLYRSLNPWKAWLLDCSDVEVDELYRTTSRWPLPIYYESVPNLDVRTMRVPDIYRCRQGDAARQDVCGIMVADPLATGSVVCLSSGDQDVGMTAFGLRLRQLDELERLEQNWDSYGADAISAKALRAARVVLQRVWEVLSFWAGEKALPMAAVPLASGGVQLEWQTVRGSLEVEIGSDGDLSYLLVMEDKGGKSFKEGSEATIPAIASAVSTLAI